MPRKGEPSHSEDILTTARGGKMMAMRPRKISVEHILDWQFATVSDVWVLENWDGECRFDCSSMRKDSGEDS
jgi:hypothetical protein